MPDTRNRLLVRVTAPASEPVSLAEAKLFLRVDTSSDDTLISDLIVAARMSAEQWLRASLISQSWKVAYDDYIPEHVQLPMGPVVSITSISAIARDGSTQIVDSSAYYLNAAQNAVILDNAVFATRVEIIYATGYGAASQIPTPIKQGILAHIGDLYDERGVDMNKAIPAQSAALYAPFRAVKL